MGGHRGVEQRCCTVARRLKKALGVQNLALLIKIRGDQPLVQIERMTRGRKNRAAVYNAQRVLHPQAQAFQHGSEMPGINCLPIHAGLATDGVEPGAIKKGGRQRMAQQRLVEPGDGGCGVFERPG